MASPSLLPVRNTCTACGLQTATTLESRSTTLASGPARRRRLACSACGHRETTYEITSDALQLLQQQAAAFATIAATIADTAAAAPDTSAFHPRRSRRSRSATPPGAPSKMETLPCAGCQHASPELISCGLALPEAFTAEAIGCCYVVSAELEGVK